MRGEGEGEGGLLQAENLRVSQFMSLLALCASGGDSPV